MLSLSFQTKTRSFVFLDEDEISHLRFPDEVLCFLGFDVLLKREMRKESVVGGRGSVGRERPLEMTSEERPEIEEYTLEGKCCFFKPEFAEIVSF